MKNSIPFELFDKNQYLYFDIQRLSELERVTGKSIINIANLEVGVNFCLLGLQIGLKHHHHKATLEFYAEKIEKYLEEGGSINEIGILIAKAIAATGIYGKDAKKRALAKDETEEIQDKEEKNEKQETE
ncbi:hypothetical protein [Sporomusa sp. KB1]|jgi:hypothetical protein|uniref:hypothetical protein n=1 Tax=Sporomusa sp. KB1 TaxID=943346 RepID=UPI0011A4BA4C|nr:hypothetical protein [Sporomusa sp. KB1]TWH49593.1 hypothetical protein Salpa_5832 [Sporomusa sp. KB1]